MGLGISFVPEKTLKAANIRVSEDMYYMKHILSKPIAKIEMLRKKIKEDE